MRHLILALTSAAGALALGATASHAESRPVFFGAASAAPASQLLFGRDVSGEARVEEAQFLWAGRNYCWYDNGWRGPGFYWCGYAFRRGLGWGGPVGWHGWSRGGFHGGGDRGGFRGGDARGGGRMGGGDFHGGGRPGGDFHGGGGHGDAHGGGHGGDHHR